MEEIIMQDKIDEEEAIRIALELERVEATRKLLREKLRDYVQENGKVDTGEKIWDITQSESWSFDSSGLRKVAEGIVLDGQNPWEYLNITPANLRKLDWDESTLEQYGKRRVTNRFTGRKK